MPTRLPAALAVAAVLALAGCGDDDEPADTTSGATGATGESGSLDRSAFIETADEICRSEGAEQEQELAARFPEGPQGATDQEIQQAATDIVVPNLRSQLDQIRELEPPEGDEDEIEAITQSLEDGIDQLESDPSTLTDGGNDAIDEASRLAREYGLTECGKG